MTRLQTIKAVDLLKNGASPVEVIKSLALPEGEFASTFGEYRPARYPPVGITTTEDDEKEDKKIYCKSSFCY